LKKLKQFLEKVTPLGFRHILKGDFMDNIEFKKIVQEITSKYEVMYCKKKYSLQGTTQGNGLTGGVPPVRFSM